MKEKLEVNDEVSHGRMVRLLYSRLGEVGRTDSDFRGNQTS